MSLTVEVGGRTESGRNLRLLESRIRSATLIHGTLLYVTFRYQLAMKYPAPTSFRTLTLANLDIPLRLTTSVSFEKVNSTTFLVLCSPKTVCLTEGWVTGYHIMNNFPQDDPFNDLEYLGFGFSLPRIYTLMGPPFSIRLTASPRRVIESHILSKFSLVTDNHSRLSTSRQASYSCTTKQVLLCPFQ